MAKKLIIKQVGVIKKVGAKAELEPEPHPKHATNHYPRDIFTDACVGANHLTFTIITGWTVSEGVFEPRGLRTSMLKRLNHVAATTIQKVMSLHPGIYELTIDGTARVGFENGGSYVWSSGSLNNFDTLSNETTTIQFNTKAPDTISIRLEDDTQHVNSISLKNEQGVEQLINNDFTRVETHFYDVESWWKASLDERMVPRDTLGFLEGFNEFNLYTIFA